MAKGKKRGQYGSLWVLILSIAGFSGLFAYMLRGRDIALLNPKGYIADQQFRLLVLSTAIMLAFAAIVLFFLYFFAWKYREGNERATYDNEAGRGKLLIVSAWVSPIIIFVILAALMLPATQKLAPQNAIASDKEEMTIRVIAMRWKWLFLYPDQDVATVNYVQIPVDTPVRFELTADEAPMNSFWIPHLGGMLYAMTEHVNPLNLMAHTVGDYDGGAAEVNGHGFAGMRFTTRVSTQEDFDKWVYDITAQTKILDEVSYDALLEPTEYDEPISFYSPTNQELFDRLLNKYSASHSHYKGNENIESGESY